MSIQHECPSFIVIKLFFTLFLNHFVVVPERLISKATEAGNSLLAFKRERENLIFTIKPDVTDTFSSLNNSVNSTKLYLQTRMYRIISCDIRMNDFSFRFKIKTFFCDPLVFFVSKSPKSKCDHAFFLKYESSVGVE